MTNPFLIFPAGNIAKSDPLQNHLCPCEINQRHSRRSSCWCCPAYISQFLICENLQHRISVPVQSHFLTSDLQHFYCWSTIKTLCFLLFKTSEFLISPFIKWIIACSFCLRLIVLASVCPMKWWESVAHCFSNFNVHTNEMRFNRPGKGPESLNF